MPRNKLIRSPPRPRWLLNLLELYPNLYTTYVGARVHIYPRTGPHEWRVRHNGVATVYVCKYSDPAEVIKELGL